MIIKQRMDTKDMLEYRKVIERKKDREEQVHGMSEKFFRLQRQCDTMDTIFDAIYVATLEEVAPQFIALTAGDFDWDSMKIAIPETTTTEAIADDTQVVIQYVEEDVAAPEKEVKTPKETLEANEEDFMMEIKKLLSRSITSNIPAAVNLYNERTGKNLLPADAYLEIKDALPDLRLIPIWDMAVATAFRTRGAVAAYAQVKKHLPNWGDTEIGRICCDAVLRSITNANTTPAAAIDLQKILDATLSREDLFDLKLDAENERILLAMKEFEDKANGVTETKLFRKFTEVEIRNGIGLIYSVMTPSKRVEFEKKNGRKPYVEKGYPA
jgi:hypothetical protein